MKAIIEQIRRLPDREVFKLGQVVSIISINGVGQAFETEATILSFVQQIDRIIVNLREKSEKETYRMISEITVLPVKKNPRQSKYQGFNQ
jgi:hypothetical protein